MSHTARSLSGANTGITKFGHNPAISSGTEETIWTGPTATLVPPTAARIHSLVSTDNVDDTDGGDGMLTVQVQYLDANWEEAEEIVILDGTTPVAMAAAAIRINRMFGATYGADKTNAGAITATAAVDATVTAHIPAGESQTQQAFYTIPVGFVGLLGRYYANIRPGSPAGAFSTVKLCAVSDADVATSGMVIKHLNSVSDSSPLDFQFNVILPTFEAKTDLSLRMDVSAVAVIVSGGLDIILLPTGASS